MLEGLSLGTLFLIAIGLVVLLAGINNLSEFFQITGRGNIAEGRVMQSRHVENHDRNGTLIQNYYDLEVRYQIPKYKDKILVASIRSTAQYEKGDSIMLALRDDRVAPYESEKSDVVAGILLLLAGAGVIAAPILSDKGMKELSWLMVAAVLALLGAAMLRMGLAGRKGRLEVVEGTITKVLLYQTERERRQIIAGTKSWYPVISYEREGRTREFLSRYNSNRKGSFKEGATVELYWDEAGQRIIEKKSTTGFKVAGIVLLAFSAYGLIATLVEMLH